jgi:hypothetical protein
MGKWSCDTSIQHAYTQVNSHSVSGDLGFIFFLDYSANNMGIRPTTYR